MGGVEARDGELAAAVPSPGSDRLGGNGGADGGAVVVECDVERMYAGIPDAAKGEAGCR